MLNIWKEIKIMLWNVTKIHTYYMSVVFDKQKNDCQNWN